MLSVEEIKKCCEFADGFEYVIVKDMTLKEVPAIRIKEKSYYIKDLFVFNELVYPLLLQRVIEGINSGKDWSINQRSLSFDILKRNGFDMIMSNKIIINDSFDQAKEQAIKYILGE